MICMHDTQDEDSAALVCNGDLAVLVSHRQLQLVRCEARHKNSLSPFPAQAKNNITFDVALVPLTFGETIYASTLLLPGLWDLIAGYTGEMQDVSLKLFSYREGQHENQATCIGSIVR